MIFVVQEPLLAEERQRDESRTFPRVLSWSPSVGSEGGGSRVPVLPEALHDLLDSVREEGRSKASFRQRVTRAKNTKRQRLLPCVLPPRQCTCCLFPSPDHHTLLVLLSSSLSSSLSIFTWWISHPLIRNLTIVIAAIPVIDASSREEKLPCCYC
jgi:hypothetical protein